MLSIIPEVTLAKRVFDPACCTGGFQFSAHQHVLDHHPNLTKDEKKHLKESLCWL